MGKFIFQYAIPAIFLSIAVWYGVKYWFKNFFSHHVAEKKTLDRKSESYDKKLNK